VSDPGGDIEAVIEATRRIAMVGASPNPTRPSNGVCRVLLDAGYEVIPVNPNADEVCGVAAVDHLSDIEGPIDLVDVFRRVEHAPGIARDAVAVGARALWLQVGLRSAEARRIATDGGLRYVEDACLGVVVDRTRHAHSRREGSA
jgi:uncharacterized protein